MNAAGRTTDQADTLRRLAITRLRTPMPEVPIRDGEGVRVISVTSGKGGVGKTNVVANLAMALAAEGKRVLVMDADLGLGNIDLLLGLKPQYTLNDVLRGRQRLTDIIMTGPNGIRIIPAGSGVQDFTNLSRDDRLRLMDEVDALEEEADILLIDTETGISGNVTYFNTAARETVMVVSPEPTSIADVYALMKLLATRHGERQFKVLVNMARDEQDALRVFKTLSQVVSRFLEVSLDYIGYIVKDERVSEAVKRQKALLEAYPRAAASYCFGSVAKTLLALPAPTRAKGNIQFLFRKLYEPPRVARCL